MISWFVAESSFETKILSTTFSYAWFFLVSIKKFFLKKIFETQIPIFQGHPASVAVTTVGNDDEDENVDVEGDTETTMYDMVYGGNGAGGGWPQHHNRMRQHQMILHSGGYNRGDKFVRYYS